MLLIFLAILSFCIFVLVIICYLLTKKKPTCIYDFAINSQIPSKTKALKETIGVFLQDDLFIIILQDDFEFLDEKYYWPKRTAYLHLSDVNNFLEKYSPDKNNYSYDQILYFVKTKVKIH